MSGAATAKANSCASAQRWPILGLARGCRASGRTPERGASLAVVNFRATPNKNRGGMRVLLTITPKGQREQTRCKISERIAELEFKLVPGLKESTAATIREQIWQLEQQLRPADDKRNPAHYRRKPPHTESWPVRKWNRDDWLTATWAAGKRSQGFCELCASAPSDMYRLVSYPNNHKVTADYVEAVCGPCAARFPREEVCPYGQV